MDSKSSTMEDSTTTPGAEDEAQQHEEEEQSREDEAMMDVAAAEATNKEPEEELGVMPQGVDKIWHLPAELKTGEEVMLGIDEAGRGPVLGPMVYAAALWKVSDDATMSAMGFNDSKALDEKQRRGLFKRMIKTPRLGWVIHSLSAKEISGKMLRRYPCSLNVMSHDAAAGMIRLALDEGVKVSEVYVDTVGDPKYYQQKLVGLFGDVQPAIRFTVAKKADSLYKTVSAASIAAKVTRDRAVEQWQWEETFRDVPRKDFGSGYPSDARTAEWIKEHIDKVFGFPSLVRFSWSTARDLLDANAAKVEWECQEDQENQAPAGVPSIDSFYKPQGSKRIKRAKYFEDRKFKLVQTEF